MNVFPVGKTPSKEAGRVLDRIKYWDPTIIPYTLMRDHELGLSDYQVGSSRDGKAWVLVGRPRNKNRSEPLAVLTDPPERHADSIAEVLARVWMASWDCDQLDPARIDGICNQVTFPQYRAVGEYFPKAPKDWLHLPAEWVVDVILSEGSCIDGEIRESLERESMEDVLKMVYAPRIQGYLLRYTLAARRVVPMLRWNVDWPLSRRGKEGPWKRAKGQGAFPWEFKTDPGLITICQEVRRVGMWCDPSYDDEPTVRLVVGGRTREEARSHWHRCGRAIRKLKKRLKAAGELGRRDVLPDILFD